MAYATNHIDVISRKIMQLEIEEMALSKETDKLSADRLAALKSELTALRDKFNAMKSQWEEEKSGINSVQKIKSDIDRVNGEIENAQRDGDYGKAAELKYGTLPELLRKLGEAEKSQKEKPFATLLRDEVTEAEIARIVAKWTGIPVTKLMEGEKQKLLHLEADLHKRIIGQDEAVRKVSEAILRSRAGISDENRPIGTFLFLGPTGVGKTELAKALSENLFDDEKNIVRIDMTEYMEKFSVSRLIGAPPGYVGYDEGGQLTEAVRRKPYSVVLFDEIEKAHPDVFNVLLQVFDDGRITDGQGRTVDFKNTIIIMTSNLGSSIILENIDSQGQITEEARDEINRLLKATFRPEFLNRLDETVFFTPLTHGNLYQITDLLLGKLSARLNAQNLKLKVTDMAREKIVWDGSDVRFGARPLRRYIQANIETAIAKTVLRGDFNDGATITVDVENDNFVTR